MVTSCGVVGCAKNRSNAPKEGFFRLPNMVNTDETSQKLPRQRHDIWLSRINRKDLTPPQLAEKNSTQHVCRSHFILGRPAALFEPSNQLFFHQSQLVNEMQGGKDKMKIKL